MRHARCVACLRADMPRRSRAVVEVGGRALCAFHAMRAEHPIACACAGCEEETAAELAAAPAGADPVRVRAAGRIARAVRRVSSEFARGLHDRRRAS